MSDWSDDKKNPKGNFLKLLKEQIDKANPRRLELTKEEATKLAKLEKILHV